MWDHLNAEMECVRRGEIAEPSIFIQRLPFCVVSGHIEPDPGTPSSSLSQSSATDASSGSGSLSVAQLTYSLADVLRTPGKTIIITQAGLENVPHLVGSDIINCPELLS